MNSRISNLEIDTFFENEENEDIKKKLYESLLNWFKQKIYKILWNYKKRNAKYLFAIFNSNQHNKAGMHW